MSKTKTKTIQSKNGKTTTTTTKTDPTYDQVTDRIRAKSAAKVEKTKAQESVYRAKSERKKQNQDYKIKKRNTISGKTKATLIGTGIAGGIAALPMANKFLENISSGDAGETGTGSVQEISMPRFR